MASPTITKSRVWYDVILDGNLGQSGRVRSAFEPYLSVDNTINSDVNIQSIFYYDTNISTNEYTIRRAYGRLPIMNFEVIPMTISEPITNFVANTDPSNYVNYTIFTTDATNLNCYSTINDTNTSISLASINTNVANVFLKKFTYNSTTVFILGIGNKLYDISLGGTNIINYNLLVSDCVYSDIFVTIDTSNNIYLTYRRIEDIVIVNYTSGVYTTSIYATLTNTNNKYVLPTIIYINSELLFFVIDTKIQNYTNGLYSTTISNNTISILNLLDNNITNCKPINVNNNLYLICTNTNQRLVQLYILNNSRNNNIYINIKNNRLYNNIFETVSLNDEQYTFYLDSSRKLHQLWNPIPIITITITSPIVSITGDINSQSSIHPTFNPSITDYGIISNDETNIINYSLNINDSQFVVADTGYTNQLIQIVDNTNKITNIKLLPSITYGSSIVKHPNYIPGYYMTAGTYNIALYYYTIFDSNGVPVWYYRNSSYQDNFNNPSICGLFMGNGPNRVMTSIFNGSLPRTIIDINKFEEYHYCSLPDGRGIGTPPWDVHESLEIKAPANRKGNIIFCSYYNGGFYLQEQNTKFQIIWEFFSTDYLTSSDPETFHINSVDVHPITGNVLCSLRQCNAVISINYITKNIDWVINPTNYFVDILINPSNTKVLTPTNEAIINNVQYDGTLAQHDARWHNQFTPITPGNDIISVYDNGTSLHGEQAKLARGVVYEIDLVNNNAIHRSSVISDLGTISGYMGSYKITKEQNGSYSHVVDYVQQHPMCIEYSGNGLVGSQNRLFEMDLPGDLYRITKGTPADLSIESMRRTSGMPYTTP